MKLKNMYYEKNSLQTQKKLSAILRLLFRRFFQKLYKKQKKIWKNEQGSAVVEAAIGVPIFLCAISVFLAMGQMIYTQAQIHYALSQTAQMYAQTESAKSQNGFLSTVEVYAAFQSFLGKQAVFSNCLKGGSRGIILTTESRNDRVLVHASYYIKVPVPYFNRLGFLESRTCSERLFSGYMEHDGNTDETDPIVYLAENASVYHTTMTCTHISIKISDLATIRGILVRGTHKPCKKCIRSGTNYSHIYLTAQGDSYHSTLHCSALKRTIRAVRLSETGGLRACSRCGRKQ